MAKKNDSVILALKKQIAEKKAALKGVEGFTPETNCSLVLGSERFNLHVATVEVLRVLLVRLNIYRMSSEDLGLTEQLEISGFKLSEWMSDVKSKLLIADKQKEEARLKVLEQKLHNLLSVDKKTELEIDELKALIG